MCAIDNRAPKEKKLRNSAKLHAHHVSLFPGRNTQEPEAEFATSDFESDSSITNSYAIFPNSRRAADQCLTGPPQSMLRFLDDTFSASTNNS
jgi:hypothetical protein